MKKRWKGIGTLCLVICGLMMAGVSVKADNGLGVTKHTKKEIATYLEESQKSISNRILYKTSPAINDLTRLDAIGELAEETCNSALARFNQYRYIAGLGELTINNTYSGYAQAAAFINAYENNGDVIYSYPQKPETMTSDKLHKYCDWGVRYSNILARAKGLVPAIDEWMKDDNGSLFSRRRMLKPSLTKTGFGYARNGYDYAAVYPDYVEEKTVMNVAWPAQVMPISFFDTSEKWTFSTGNTEDIANVHVTVTRLNDNKSWTFGNSKGLTVNNQKYGQIGCLIFRPSLNSLSADDKFQVHITGLVDGDVTYFVEFFDPDNYEEEPECSKHHFDANGKCTNCDKNVGNIVNKNYGTSYIYNGSAIAEPLTTNFIIPEGAATPVFTWYDGDQTASSDLNSVASQKRNTMPVDAGTYTLVVETPAHDTETATYDASSIRIKVVIAKATPTDYIKPTGLTAKCGDMLSTVSLKVNDKKEQGSFVWTDSDAELKAGSNEEGQTIRKTAKYIPTDTKNYNEVEGIVLSIQVTHQVLTDSAVAATCEREGKTEGRRCSACSTEFVKQETIQPLKHHYNADGQCSNCNKNIGTIINNYNTDYVYCGYAISKPAPADFILPAGVTSLVFTWYNGDQTGVADLNTVSAQKIENEPVNAGTYTLIVEAPAHDTTEAKYDASSIRIKVVIAKATPDNYIKPTELTAKCGDMLSAVSLKVNDKKEQGSFVWTDSDVKLEAGSDVNGQTITKRAKYVPADTKNYNEVDGIELSIKVEHQFELIGGASHNAKCTSCAAQSLSTTCVGGKATCTSQAICSICGKPYGDVDTTINGHEYEPVYNWSENGDSCTVEFICKRAGCSGSVQNHKLTDTCVVTSKVIKQATCTQEEITTRTAACSFNNIEYTKSKDFVTKSALGHQEVIDPAVAATCVQEGKTEGKHCSVCKMVTLEQKVVPALGHVWDEGKITKGPTKTEEGIKTYTCKNCKATRTEMIARLTGDSDNPGGNTGSNKKPGGDSGDGKQPSAPSDTTGGGQQPSAPTDNTETVKVGMVTSDDKAAAQYQITNVDKKEVSFAKPVNKKAKKITVPDTVKIDGKTYKVTCVSGKAFSGANKCKTITIDKNVTSIKANAFSGCKNVKTIIFKTTKLTKKTVAKNAFKGITKKTTIKVPKKKLSSYKKIFKSKGLSSKVKVKA